MGPDNDASIAKKLAALQTSGLDLSIHTNLRLSPKTQTTGWTSNLDDLPFISFTSLYKYYVEWPINTVMGTDGDQAECESSLASRKTKACCLFADLTWATDSLRWSCPSH